MVPEMMIPARIPLCAILIALLLLPGIAAAADYRFALGDTVPLSGYSYGSDRAYLFLTGPTGLPSTYSSYWR